MRFKNNMSAQTKSLPKVLSFSEAKYYIFSFAFVASAVFFPWLAHQFHLAGQIFLPMHIFVLMAGFLFGWKTGLVVGVMSPLMSYSLTQMPVSALLSQVVLELAVYGLAIGLLRERNFNIWISLLVAMVAGRLARILFILFLVPKMSVFQFVVMSWPGIALQIALIPLVAGLVKRFLSEQNNA